MADDVLKQKIGGTFAEDLGVETEYREVEDVSAEQFDNYIETTAAELYPELLCGQEPGCEGCAAEDQDSVEFGEYLSFLGSTLDDQSRSLDHLSGKLEDMSIKIDRIQKVMNKIVDAVTVLLENQDYEIPLPADECEEDVFGDDDLEDLPPKKKGTPGRPVKEATKTPLPPKKEKIKKPAAKKKKPAAKPAAKPVAKKKAPVKKKAAKKKSKR